jgi:hypothetical protein
MSFETGSLDAVILFCGKTYKFWYHLVSTWDVRHDSTSETLGT